MDYINATNGMETAETGKGAVLTQKNSLKTLGGLGSNRSVHRPTQQRMGPEAGDNRRKEGTIERTINDKPNVRVERP